jgi:hypothetical protein
MARTDRPQFHERVPDVQIGKVFRFGYSRLRPLLACRPLPVYLTPLGSVQAFFTVGIGSQVDGKLEEVLFTAEQRSPAE